MKQLLFIFVLVLSAEHIEAVCPEIVRELSGSPAHSPLPNVAVNFRESSDPNLSEQIRSTHQILLSDSIFPPAVRESIDGFILAFD